MWCPLSSTSTCNRYGNFPSNKYEIHIKYPKFNVVGCSHMINIYMNYHSLCQLSPIMTNYRQGNRGQSTICYGFKDLYTKPIFRVKRLIISS